MNGDLYKPAMTDYYPQEAMELTNYKYPADFWHGLQPGQVTIGEFTGSQYNTYSTGMPSNLFADNASLYNTYLACTPKKEPKQNWLPIVFRLPDNAPAIRYYDVVMDQNYLTGTSGHIAEFMLEGSVDGLQWTKLHETDGCVHARYISRASNSNVTWTAGQNCLANDFGFPIAGSPAAPAEAVSLATVSEIKVAAGTTLAAEGEVELPKLSVDCSGGNRTVEGFTISETGVLNLTNVPAGQEFILPVDFVDCTNLENLIRWNVFIGGKESRKYVLNLKNGKLCFQKRGTVLVFR